MLTPLFYEDPPVPLYCLPPFSNFVQPFLLTFLSPPTPLLFLFSCFLGWISDDATFDVLFNGSTHFKSWYLLVPEKDLDVCFMQQDIKFTKVWHIMCFFTVHCFDITHTNTQTKTDTAHSGASRLTHPCIWIYIYTPLVMCSHLLPLLH